MSRTSSKEDWVCADVKCKNINFAKRDRCNRCGKPRKHGHASDLRPEIGKHASEKSKGLFSPDDWICKSCGNINWARRNTCNVCNVSKIDTQGERTGYGGGFMERDEVVEYNRHGDSDDDEFDEFGRKKKRFRKNVDEQQRAPQEREKGSDPKDTDGGHGTTLVERKLEEDDEEEESGDDADLSKYDVWGADDDDDEKSKDGPKSKTLEPDGNKSRKRSRSQSTPSSSSESDDSSSSGSSSSSARTSHGSRSGSSTSSRSHRPRNHHTPKSNPPTSKSSENDRRHNGRDRSRFGCAKGKSNDRDTILLLATASYNAY